MNITEFLEARIAEDEAAAEKLAGVAHSARTQVYTGEEWVTTPVSTERILAECAAKRAIIKQAEEATSLNEYGISQSCINEAEAEQARAEDPGMLTLKALAAVYKDHPDYQQDWACT